MFCVNDDMQKIIDKAKKIDEKDRICLPDVDLVYKILMEKSAQIKSGKCPEPYPYNPLPRPWWEK